jgi:hypothetical protein
MKMLFNTQSSLDRAYVCLKHFSDFAFLYPESKSKPCQVSSRFIEVSELVSDIFCESMCNILFGNNFDSHVCMSNN